MQWKRLYPILQHVLPSETEYLCFHPPLDVRSVLRSRLGSSGRNCIISAGGDGSLNYVLNALMTLSGLVLENIYLGGIGLGSSNDFLKPVTSVLESIPVRISFANSTTTDVGKVAYKGIDGMDVVRYFIVNASVGATAEANLLFNCANGLIGSLKKWSTNLAILYAALKTIVTYSNISVTLATSQDFPAARDSVRIQLSNLAVLKNPNVSGNLSYDQDIAPDDGLLGLNYCVNMNRFELMRVLRDLSGGTFSGKSKRHSSKVISVDVCPEHPVALEMDGEVVQAENIRFSLSSRKIKLLGCN